MITELSLVNFQAHSNSHFDLCSGVNVIVGVTDSGKTSVIRALDWLCNSAGNAEALKKDDTEYIEVSAAVDGAQVMRTRKGKINSYYLDDSTLTAFGTGVPEPVSAVLKMHSVNLQNQHDAVFLIAATPWEVARYLNDVSGIAVIDEALKKIASAVKECNRNISGISKNIEVLETELEQFAGLPDLRSQFGCIEAVAVEYSEVDGMVEKLQKLILDYAAVVVPELPQDVDLLLDGAAGVVSQVGEMAASINSVCSLLAAIPVVFCVPDFEQQFVRCSVLVEQARHAADGIVSLDKIIASVVIMETELSSISEVVVELKAQLPEVCPVCGQPYRFQLGGE